MELLKELLIEILNKEKISVDFNLSESAIINAMDTIRVKRKKSIFDFWNSVK